MEPKTDVFNIFNDKNCNVLKALDHMIKYVVVTVSIFVNN